MPETEKTVTVEMTNNATVTLDDTTSLAGKVITASLAPVENPSTTIKGTAYEFEFTADGAQYNGKMQVTVPYTKSGEGVPVVFFIDGDNAVKMKVVSTTANTVTFETDHNSVYVISQESEEQSLLNIVVMSALFVAVLAAAMMAIFESRKKA